MRSRRVRSNERRIQSGNDNDSKGDLAHAEEVNKVCRKTCSSNEPHLHPEIVDTLPRHAIEEPSVTRPRNNKAKCFLGITARTVKVVHYLGTGGTVP